MTPDFLTFCGLLGIGLLYWSGSTLFMGVLEPAAFIMTRKMLLGLKGGAEESAAQAPDSAMPSPRHIQGAPPW